MAQTTTLELQAPPTPSQHVYFDDGDVALVTENTVFRVHSEKLTQRSDVFRDMLILATTPDTKNTDGSRLSDMRRELVTLLGPLCDVTNLNPLNFFDTTGKVHLAAHDLTTTLRKHTLDALGNTVPAPFKLWGGIQGNHRDSSGAKELRDAEVFDGCPVVQLADSREDLEALLGAIYDTSRLKCDTFNTLAGVLRLATKYKLDDLRKGALHTLSLSYPPTLSQWDAHHGPRHPPERIITLARQTGARTLLPAAFYHLCSFPSEHVLGSPTPLLSLPDICTYYKGKDQVATVWPNCVRAEWNVTSDTHCPDPKCRRGWNGLAEREQWDALASVHFLQPDPLGQLMRYAGALDRCEGLCERERSAAKERVAQQRGKIWAALPMSFGLGTWGELSEGS